MWSAWLLSTEDEPRFVGSGRGKRDIERVVKRILKEEIRSDGSNVEA